jgi:pimeloyl-ACP methyl ester carboxylesterase
VDQQTIRLGDGHVVGWADYGAPSAMPVLWCHGAPGSRLEPAHVERQARERGLRLVGIDRPGYGLSNARPERTIASWVPEALAVADHLGIEHFVTVGTSTGGAFALAVAALAPQRVLGVVACCSLTDMRWPEGRATMSTDHTHAVWDAPDRAGAVAAAVDAHGAHGNKLRGGGMDAVLAPSDRALFGDPEWMKLALAEFPAMFAQGLEGYADDRRADGPGWVSFDVASIRCPVTVLHGSCDRMVDVIHARHTTELVPHARLVVINDLGHFSIVSRIVPTICQMLRPAHRSNDNHNDSHKETNQSCGWQLREGRFEKGTFESNASGLDAAAGRAGPTLNPTTCSLSISGTGPVTLFDGTGLYKGISGKPTLTESFGLVNPRIASGPNQGKCNLSHNVAPLRQYGAIIGAGKVRFG